MKNINSFKSLHDALEYEICRQAEVLEEGGIVYQETRHWEPANHRTVVMRVKETADDYRLFPDPDLAPFDLSDEFIEACRARIPELPDAKRARYVDELGLRKADAAWLAGEPGTAAFFEAAVEAAGTKLAGSVANVVVNNVAAFANAAGATVDTCGLTPEQVAGLAKLLSEDAITAAQGREVLELMASTGDAPDKIVDERGMRQTTDTDALAPVVDAVLARCQDQVQQYRDGNRKVVGFLVGQCMRESHGTGNPKLFNQMLVERLEG